MDRRIVISALLFAISFSCGAEEAKDQAKFSLVCEWRSNYGNGGSETFHIDTAAKTVNGKKAKITESTIYFVKGAVEHTIDRTSGVLTRNDLNDTRAIRLASPITRCSKTQSRKF